MMIPWLHFTGGDNLYFKSVHPSSKGAIAGACLVLVLLAIFERWVSAMRAVLEAHWRKRALAIISRRSAESDTPQSCDDSEKSMDVDAQTGAQGVSRIPSRLPKSARMIAPFIPAHDIPRGVVHTLQAFLSYTLMLAVMTFNASYVISIVIGLGIGEMLFGRMGSAMNIL